jgi:dienelactone hydrolase
MLADAFAALVYLDALPEIDGDRVVLVGFSYGGMAATYAVYAQVAERLALNGERFAGHVAFYAPCIAHFEDNRTTGAPVLMLAGTGDAIVDPERCAKIAEELEAGGSEVTTIYYEGAYHQWDGRFDGPRPIGRNLAPCSFYVDDDGDVYDAGSWLPMSGPFMRKLILGLCSDGDGYLIGRDEEIRARAIVDWSRFMNSVFDG